MRRLTFLLAASVAAFGTVTLAASAARDSRLRLTLPPLCYAVVGVPTSIYYDNIILAEKPDGYRFAVRCELGTTEDRRWTVAPTAGDVGDHPLSITISDGNGRLVERGKLILRVVPADAGAGRGVRLLIVGDSLTHATAYPNEIARLLSRPGNPTWTMLGTHRPPFAAKGVGHEGYGGWTWEMFASHYVATPDPSKNIRSSPFVFAVDGKPALDLPRYFRSSCGGQPPDFITFLLGINDCFSAKADNPAAIDARIDAMFTHADKLIAAFRQAAPKAELGICLTTPPNSRESGFEANYQGAYHRWGWKSIQHRLVQRELEHFGSRECERIFAVPTELNLDPVDGYPADNAAHPNEAGYRQVGASIYAWIKSRLAASQP